MEQHDVSYKGKLKFISHYEPPLDAGRYTIEVSQQIKALDGTLEKPIGEKTEFLVSAPRFAIDESDIFSVYPPRGGAADYDGVVPSMSFSRPTLPWERSPSVDDKRDGAAWLALILVDQDDMESGRAKEVYADEANRTRLQLHGMEAWLGLRGLGTWERYDPTQQLQVLELKNELFDELMPTYGDLKLLSHARQNLNDAGVVTSEVGTVLGNRMPAPGRTNTVYLVSVEERYATSKDDCKARHIGGNEGAQRLVILDRWQFHCRDSELYSYTVTPEILHHSAPQHEGISDSNPLPDWVSFEFDGEEGKTALREQVLTWLRGDSSSPTATLDEQADTIVQASQHREGTFSEILQNVRVGLLRDAPDNGHSVTPDAQHLFESGHTVLKHHLRAGGRTHSWFKGALAARELGDMGFALPAGSADDILVFQEATGMFDASYAAAWALGRLKGMENKAVAISLFRWRHERLHAQVGHQHDHLPVAPLPESPLPEDVVEQIEGWKLLRGIPFEYLVPHPKLLPNESLRFFHLDCNWMRCFIDGFFGVAKVHGLTDFAKEQALFPNFDRPITGVLLRSDAVAGWPSLHVNAYAEAIPLNHFDPDARHIRLLRKEQLESDVLLLLFEGVPQTIDLYLSPEGVHSGLEREDTDDDSPRYTRSIRNPTTGEGTEGQKAVAIAEGVGSQQYRTFSATALKQQFEERTKGLPGTGEAFSAGNFGLQLIDGTPLVRYQLRS